MKIVHISDTHGGIVETPSADMLIHTGDFTRVGTLQEIQDFADYLKSREHLYKYILVISGNHDRSLDPFWGAGSPDASDSKDRAIKAQSIIEDASKKITYLFDDEVVIDDFKFYGSPHTPEFGFNWAFNKLRGSDLDEVWREIPEDTDVLLTHGPPMGILDECPDYHRPRKMAHAGCANLRHHVSRVQPKLHLFGHIHEGAGFLETDETTFVNASIMDGRYRPRNHPWIIDLERSEAKVSPASLGYSK